MDETQLETTDEVIARLRLEPHAYDGWFAPLPNNETGIYRLIGVGDFIGWHQLPVSTLWRHEAGAALTLSQSSDGFQANAVCLDRQSISPSLSVGENVWQTAESLGAWSLVSCVYEPALAHTDLIDAIKLAPDNWYPGLGH